MKHMRRVFALVCCLALLCPCGSGLAMVSDSLWAGLLTGYSTPSYSGDDYVSEDLWDDLYTGGALSQDDYYSYNGAYPAPEFPYISLDCALNQKLSTRTGPGTQYTEPGTFSSKTEVVVFYQTDRESTVPWGYVEFFYKNKLYRAYTGMKRLDTYREVPYCEESVSFYVTLTQSFKPYYGPAYDYATLPKAVAAGARVPAFFTENGWLMFDYELSDGRLQRGWAPPDCWQ